MFIDVYQKGQKKAKDKLYDNFPEWQHVMVEQHANDNAQEQLT